jgi:hypothetical protein
VQIDRYVVSLPVNASGAGTGFTPVVDGCVRAIRYVPDGSTPYDTNAIVTITGEASGIAIVTITHVGTSAVDIYPRAAVASVADASALYAAGGTAVTDLIPVAERIQIAITAGGVSMTGVFHVYVG